MTDYITLDEFRHYLFPGGNAGFSEITEAQAAVTAASRMIDTFCARRFYADEAATVRYYQPCDPYQIDVDDIASTVGLAVAVDSNDDGTYDQTWTVTTDYYAAPVNREKDGISGLPYTSLRSVGIKAYPCGGWRPNRVSVTAKWGWPAVPDPVKQATFIKAAKIFRRSKTPDGFAGGSELGLIRLTNREDFDVVTLLGPYRKFGGAGLVVA